MLPHIMDTLTVTRVAVEDEESAICKYASNHGLRYNVTAWEARVI